MSIGISILAYGDEHINECKLLLNQLIGYDLKFYITTNLPDSFNVSDKVVIIPTNENFNYNLKRFGFEVALMENDCVIQMDTDIYVKGIIDFTILNDIDDGMYLKWKNVVNKNLKLSSKIEYQYIDKVKKNTGINELFFIDESVLIFKITNNEIKEKLVSNWNILYEQTLDVQPQYRNNGAVEGVLIYASALMSNLKISNEFNQLFDNFFHYLTHGKLNLEKKII